jgi:hypothetical protein
MIHLLILDGACAYRDPKTGHHQHLEANSLVELDAAVAHELVFPAKRAKYIDPNDMPPALQQVSAVLATPAELLQAKVRREYEAKRVARAHQAA